MLQSYVGIITSQGLESLVQETERTTRLVTRFAYGNRLGRTICCWAAVQHSVAMDVRRLVDDGDRARALEILNGSARFLGPILPSDHSAGGGH